MSAEPAPLNDTTDAWLALAACRGRTTLFFADDAFSQRLALAICRRCPVRLECLADARAFEPSFWRSGVVAGLTAQERRAWD